MFQCGDHFFKVVYCCKIFILHNPITLCWFSIVHTGGMGLMLPLLPEQHHLFVNGNVSYGVWCKTHDRFCHLFSCCSAIFRMFNPRRLGGAYMCQWTGRQCISGTNNYLLSVGLLQIVLWNSWWRHPMETFSALLAICAGNSPVPGEFPTQRPVTQSFDVFFNLRLNKRLSKQSWGWWFETGSCPLWRHRNV